MLVSNFWFIGMKIISYLLFQLKRLQYLHERSFFSRELLLWVRTNVLLCDSLQVQVIIWPWDIFWPNNAIHQFTSCSSKWKKNLAQKWFLVYLCLNRNLLSCKGCCWASERPKPLFGFRPDTETETLIGRYFRPIPKPIPKPQKFRYNSFP